MSNITKKKIYIIFYTDDEGNKELVKLYLNKIRAERFLDAMEAANRHDSTYHIEEHEIEDYFWITSNEADLEKYK